MGVGESEKVEECTEECDDWGWARARARREECNDCKRCERPLTPPRSLPPRSLPPARSAQVCDGRDERVELVGGVVHVRREAQKQAALDALDGHLDARGEERILQRKGVLIGAAAHGAAAREPVRQRHQQHAAAEAGAGVGQQREEVVRGAGPPGIE